MMSKPKIFISYSSRDAGMALEWVMVLRERGVNAFCAYEHINPGDDWNEKIREALIECDELILLCSPEAAESDWVLMEIGAAWALGKRITPILLYGTVEQLPDHLRRIQFANIGSVRGLTDLIDQICARHSQQATQSNTLPFTFKLGSRDRDLPPQNDSPSMTVTPYQPNWVRCPCCEKAFSLRNPSSWNGTHHMTCGQRLVIAVQGDLRP
jgi:hypothetical protein